MEQPLIVERTYHAPVAKVWKAITNREDMKQWYFEISEFKPEVGFEFTFEGGDGNKTFVHRCRITDVIIEKKLTYSWSYEGYPGISYVTFELFAEGNKTRVRLTHSGFETFPKVAEFNRKNFEAGWNEIIGKLLMEFVER